MSERVVALCPGRGSYTADTLGSLAGLREHPRAAELAAAVEALDAQRGSRGDPPVLEMDAAEAFSSRILEGTNVAPLIFAVTAFDYLRLDPGKARVVALGGNSMGWYSALGCAGALDAESALRLVTTVAEARRDGPTGGQVVYPVVDDQWRPDNALEQAVAHAVEETAASGARVGSSIRYGGFRVLWGDDDAVTMLLRELPQWTMGERRYPMQLYGNSAFHSPIMRDVSELALGELAGLRLRRPRVPLIDGQGAQHRPLACRPEVLRRYTLVDQMTETFDFHATVVTALREYAPDRIVLLGPGDSLGAAVGQVLVRERWRGIDSRERFLRVQREDPFVLSMARPEQAARVV